MNKTYTFNRDKYKAVLKKRGLNQKMVAIALGRSRSYASHLTMDYAFIDDLKKYYNISPEDIDAVPVCKEKQEDIDAVPVCKEKQEDNEKPESDDPGLDYDQLYRCIYGAVYQAVKKALSE